MTAIELARRHRLSAKNIRFAKFYTRFELIMMFRGGGGHSDGGYAQAPAGATIANIVLKPSDQQKEVQGTVPNAPSVRQDVS